jgi:hypothetical protein
MNQEIQIKHLEFSDLPILDKSSEYTKYIEIQHKLRK